MTQSVSAIPIGRRSQLVARWVAIVIGSCAVAGGGIGLALAVTWRDKRLALAALFIGYFGGVDLLRRIIVGREKLTRSREPRAS